MRISIPPKAELEKLISNGLNIKSTAAYYGVTPATVTNWRHGYGIESNAPVKRETVDVLLAEG
ncbi:MAG: helix-turn-helix domain-containing protein, partial [Pseudomonadota bacterium]